MLDNLCHLCTFLHVHAHARAHKHTHRLVLSRGDNRKCGLRNCDNTHQWHKARTERDVGVSSTKSISNPHTFKPVLVGWFCWCGTYLEFYFFHSLQFPQFVYHIFVCLLQMKQAYKSGCFLSLLYLKLGNRLSLQTVLGFLAGGGGQYPKYQLHLVV